MSRPSRGSARYEREVNIVDRSDAHDEEAVRKAFGDDAVEADRAEGQRAPQEIADGEKQAAPRER
jgi:hypothetical protein